MSNDLGLFDDEHRLFRPSPSLDSFRGSDEQWGSQFTSAPHPPPFRFSHSPPPMPFSRTSHSDYLRSSSPSMQTQDDLQPLFASPLLMDEEITIPSWPPPHHGSAGSISTEAFRSSAGMLPKRRTGGRSTKAAVHAQGMGDLAVPVPLPSTSSPFASGHASFVSPPTTTTPQSPTVSPPTLDATPTATISSTSTSSSTSAAAPAASSSASTNSKRRKGGRTTKAQQKADGLDAMPPHPPLPPPSPAVSAARSQLSKCLSKLPQLYLAQSAFVIGDQYEVSVPPTHAAALADAHAAIRDSLAAIQRAIVAEFLVSPGDYLAAMKDHWIGTMSLELVSMLRREFDAMFPHSSSSVSLDAKTITCRPPPPLVLLRISKQSLPASVLKGRLLGDLEVILFRGTQTVFATAPDTVECEAFVVAGAFRVDARLESAVTTAIDASDSRVGPDSPVARFNALQFTFDRLKLSEGTRKSAVAIGFSTKVHVAVRSDPEAVLELEASSGYSAPLIGRTNEKQWVEAEASLLERELFDTDTSPMRTWAHVANVLNARVWLRATRQADPLALHGVDPVRPLAPQDIARLRTSFFATQSRDGLVSIGDVRRFFARVEKLLHRIRHQRGLADLWRSGAICGWLTRSEAGRVLSSCPPYTACLRMSSNQCDDMIVSYTTRSEPRLHHLSLNATQKKDTVMEQLRSFAGKPLQYMLVVRDRANSEGARAFHLVPYNMFLAAHEAAGGVRRATASAGNRNARGGGANADQSMPGSGADGVADYEADINELYAQLSNLSVMTRPDTNDTVVYLEPRPAVSLLR